MKKSYLIRVTELEMQSIALLVDIAECAKEDVDFDNSHDRAGNYHKPTRKWAYDPDLKKWNSVRRKFEKAKELKP